MFCRSGSIIVVFVIIFEVPAPADTSGMSTSSPLAPSFTALIIATLQDGISTYIATADSSTVDIVGKYVEPTYSHKMYLLSNYF